MKILFILLKIWDFISRIAYVVTEIDEAIEQCKTFWKWWRGGDENEQDKREKSR